MVELPFQDRAEAGRLLGAELASRKPGTKTVVMALARGGLPIGFGVAEALEAPLDVVVVRKLGVPWQPELAIGAIAGSTRVLDRRVIREFHISDDQVESVVAKETEEMARREKLYRRDLEALDPAGRTVVLVDDGLATGSTMVAAARYIRSAYPHKLIVAVPVGTSQACNRLRKEADECVCLALPEPFFAVGEWYTDFRQMTDAQVQAILRRSNTRVESAR